MDTLIFYTQRSRPKSDAEAGGGRRITETAGYVPMEVQINNLIRAGKRLKASRAEQFDFPDGQAVEDYLDVMRSPNFDLVDAQHMHEALKERLRERNRQRQEQRAAEEKKLKEELLLNNDSKST